MPFRPQWYILKETRPVRVKDLDEWVRQLDYENRHVGYDVIGDVCVSTVFLGLDLQHGKGPPLLFETLIRGGEHNGSMRRCSTWDEAEWQHKRAVEMVKAHLPVRP